MKETKRIELNFRKIKKLINSYLRGTMADPGYFKHLQRLRLKYYNQLAARGFKLDYNL